MKLVLLHGHDAIPGDLLGVAEAVRGRLPAVEVALLPGPVRLPSGRFAWWADDDGPSAGVARVATYANVGPVVVAGFSQGGAVALAAANIAGVLGAASIGGFLVEPVAFDESTAPMFIAHGRDDEVVDVFHAESLARRLARANVDHVLVLHDGGHEWPDAVTGKMVAWLATLIDDAS
jgi:predicted esterase